MIRVEPGVNRANYATPWSGIHHPNAAQAGEHQSIVCSQRTKRFVQVHNSSIRECYFASIALH
jgi:hypothetical protein